MLVLESNYGAAIFLEDQAAADAQLREAAHQLQRVVKDDQPPIWEKQPPLLVMVYGCITNATGKTVLIKDATNGEIQEITAADLGQWEDGIQCMPMPLKTVAVTETK